MTMSKSDLYRNLPRLHTKRLLLRTASDRDVADMFAYASDADVTRHLRWGPHAGREQTQEYLAGVLAQYRDGTDGPWLMEDLQTGHIIGHIHLMELDTHNCKAQVGFVLAKDCWNRGLATEALEKMLAFSFEFGLNRIEALPLTDNLAAARVLEKAGFTEEGRLRHYAHQKGAFRDFRLYAILREEFGP